jgi:galactokinase
MAFSLCQGENLSQPTTIVCPPLAASRVMAPIDNLRNRELPVETTVADDPKSTTARQAFELRFSCSPQFMVAAPGRVNVIGEHIDYNDGFVLPMAIERYVTIAARVREDDSDLSANFFSVDLDDEATVERDDVMQPRSGEWVRYVQGVLAEFLQLHDRVPGFDAVIQSNVPLGGGLSSSAALEVAMATLLEAITGHQLDPAQKALLCQRAEHRFAGVPCGIMDQFSSVLGNEGELILLDCRSQSVQSVPFPEAEITMLITNSNVSHELVGGQYAERRQQCDSALRKLQKPSWRDVTLDDVDASREDMSQPEYRRAKHVVSEIARTTAAAQAFRDRDWNQVGELMFSSHESLRDDFQVSCEELDLLVDLAREIGNEGGVIGSRMTGGGFGGCTVTLVKSECADSVMKQLAERYESKTGIKPSCFVSRPARGAYVMETEVTR